MSRKVILIAGVLVAAGSVAALSSPQVRGSRLGALIEDTVFGSAEDDGRGARRQRMARQDLNEDDERPGFQDRASRKRDRAARRKAEQPVDNSVDDGDDNDGRQARRGSERRAHARDDGREVSRNETRNAADNDGRGSRRFAELDRNGDGVIDAEEFAAAAAERAKIASRRFFRRFDADRDGKVTKEEFNRASRERIANAERDDDTVDAELPPRVRGRDVVR